MKTLTITIPAYNAENYISKCIESLLDGDIRNQLEIIIINDGSVDSTGKIAKTYELKYPGIVQVVNKENGGHGSGVNTGISKATGKYFMVLDSDDWFSTAELKNYIYFLNKADAEVILNNYCFVDINTGNIKQEVYKNVDYSKKYSMQEFLYLKEKIALPNICYCTKFIQKISLRLHEKTYYVDEEYLVIPFMYANNIQFYNAILYNYLVGQSNQSVAFSNQVKHLDDKKKVILRLAELWENTAMTAANKKYTLLKISTIALSYFPIALIYNPLRKDGVKKSRELLRQIKNKSTEIYQSIYIKCLVYIFMGKFSFPIKWYEVIQQKRGNSI